jgi:hypothetical protein
MPTPGMPATPGMPTPGMPAGPGMSAGPTLSPAEAKALLTEEKISRFATYQRMMSSVSKDAMGMGMKAIEKGGTDQKKVEKAATSDQRFGKVADANKAALEKSKLSQNDVSKLNQVLSPYYGRIYAMTRMFGKAPDAKPAEAPAPGSMEAARLKAQEGRELRVETLRKEFGGQYGADALELVRKHEPEFMEITGKMMSGAMGALVDKK